MINQKRDELDLWGEPGLLWLDGHSSRLSEDAVILLRDNNITCAIIPSHTSHILQPLDRGVNGAFKLALRRDKHTKENSSAPKKRREIDNDRTCFVGRLFL
eukprot:c4382_g1_i1.p2 GENE.c4382_g1_i1~~c4382_g1_i1.p2  ORF type:complete len:101 (+),score=13.13 c4382_g1_i1:882-1184(+)